MEYSGYDGLSTLTTGHCTRSACSDTAQPATVLTQPVQTPDNRPLYSLSLFTHHRPGHCAHSACSHTAHPATVRQVSHRQTLWSVTSSQPSSKHRDLSCQVSHRQTPCVSVTSSQPSSKHRDLSRQVSHRQTPCVSVTSSQPSSKNAAIQADQRASDTNIRPLCAGVSLPLTLIATAWQTNGERKTK